MDAHEQIANQTFSSVDSNGSSVAAIVLECNKIAMEHLRNDNFNAALDLLKKAEQLLTFEYQQNPSENIYRLIGITLNNLGCFYKRNEKPKVALRYLKKALVIEAATVNDESNLAGTHLNICAISSHMKHHEAALEHVQFALDLLEKARKNVLMDEKGEYIIDPDTIRSSKQLEKTDYIKADHYRTILTTMIIGYCNYGTELEYLKRYHQSAQAYRQGYEVARDELGEPHPMTQALHNNYHSVIAKKKDYEEEIEKKNAHKLKLFEANKGIRIQHTRQQRFELQQSNPPRKKVVEYGFDGRRHVKTRILSKHEIQHNKSTRRNNSLKLPKISGPASEYDKSTIRINATNEPESKRLFVADRDGEEFERDLKDYYNTAFTPSYGLLDKKKAQNQSTSSEIRDDTIVSNRSVQKKRGNLNKTVDYGTIASDDESFFKAIDYQIKDLDMKIHKTKKDISNIKNTSEPNISTLQPGANSSKLIPDVIISTPKQTNITHIRHDSFPRPPLSHPISQPKIRPTSQESKNSDGATVFAKKEREINKQLYDIPSDPYGRVNSEDSEPQRPGSKHRMLLSSNRQAGSDRGDGHESPLFDIVQEIEKNKQTTNPTNPTNTRNLSNFILVNNNINTIKEEPNEERRNSTAQKSGRDSQGGLNSKRSNQSQQKINPDEKSVDQQIAEVQKSLEGYKKQLKSTSGDGNSLPTTGRGNNSGRTSKDANKLKSQNTQPKLDETKEEKIDNYLKYFE